MSPRTVRYYDRVGLLTASYRTASGHRRYGPADRERLRFVLKAKAVGLTLGEIRELLTLRDRGVKPCGRVLEIVQEKLGQVEVQLGALVAFRDELAAIQREALERASGSESICSLVEHHRWRHDPATIRRAARVLTLGPGGPLSRRPSRA